MNRPLTISALLLTVVSPVSATEIVYVPVNPSFGGNPLNGQMLLNNAQSQNEFDDKGKNPGGPNQQSALDQFNAALQRAILNRLTSAITGSIVGANGEIIPGTIETTDFIIVIVDLGGGLMQITTTDKVTGDSTSFQISTTI